EPETTEAPAKPETTQAPAKPTEPQQSAPPKTEPLTEAQISALFESAMAELKPEVKLNVAGLELKFGLESGLKNIYYSVLADKPELKYTYDMQVKVSGTEAECSFLFMPYKTGAYTDKQPAGSHIVDSLRAAEVMAQSMNGADKLSIAITDPTILVEDLQRALGQAGYGMISYTLSRDGTEILAAPAMGMTLEECISLQNETFALGGDILAEIITDGMGEREKIEAIYAYITNNVSYDFRYYNDKENMPFASTLAYGALKDGTAICGGYAHALETLLNMAGIENYTVSGVSGGEYHSWNYVCADGVFSYCDPTADRGGMSTHFLLSSEELAKKGGYEWDDAFYRRLTLAQPR
ncbi:MAG: transglutaminase-like domain-containing protein, partial [Oscillospiraceae bacterium]